MARQAGGTAHAPRGGHHTAGHRGDRHPGAEEFVPDDADLDGLAAAAADCHGCDLYRNATRTVFGSGRAGAPVMLVGEQPGDVEDRQGEPFVGPAGHLLDRALADAGITPETTYRTNAVKHFRWKQAATGKRRLHEKPDAGQIAACVPWLHAELARVQPRIVVVLGATAARALCGPSFRVTAARGTVLPWHRPDGARPDLPDEVALVATVHPSAVLRAPDRHPAYEAFVADLRVVAGLLNS